jgi:predicted amidophosphoribosyltransferase
MKTCPQCNSQIEENFDLCWNCLFSFSQGKTQTKDEFKLVCNRCGEEANASANFCSHCGLELTITGNKPEKHTEKLVLNCMRCNAPMRYAGKRKFQERTWVELPLLEYMFHKECFELYICTNCYQMEFYLEQ